MKMWKAYNDDRQLTKFGSENLTWAYGSGELNLRKIVGQRITSYLPLNFIQDISGHNLFGKPVYVCFYEYFTIYLTQMFISSLKMPTAI